MKKKELLKENWLDFMEGTNLDEEMPNIELMRLVFDSMKNCRLYRGKPSKALTKRFDELSTFKRELEDISNISIVRRANVNCQYDLKNTYLIIEDKYGPNVILDLTNGYDDSCRFGRLFLTENSEIEELYSSDEKSEIMQLSEIQEVVYYPRATLINDFTKVELLKGSILEITDTLNDKLYVNCYTQKLFYGHNNCSIVDNPKKIDLFKYDVETEIPDHIFNFKCDIMNLLCDIK